MKRNNIHIHNTTITNNDEAIHTTHIHVSMTHARMVVVSYFNVDITHHNIIAS